MSDMRPRLLVIAGPNGTGKTTLTKRILKHAWGDGCTYINPDNIARDKFGDWNSPDAVLKAARLAEQMREDCLTQRKDLAFETVLSTPGKVDFIKRAKEAGYFVRMFFVGTDDPRINAARVANRVIEGGHDVPITKIIDRYHRSMGLSLDVTQLADRAYFYDNSPEGQDPLLEFKTLSGAVAKFYRQPHEWAVELIKSLPSPTIENEAPDLPGPR